MGLPHQSFSRLLPHQKLSGKLSVRRCEHCGSRRETIRAFSNDLRRIAPLSRARGLSVEFGDAEAARMIDHDQGGVVLTIGLRHRCATSASPCNSINSKELLRVFPGSEYSCATR